MDGFVGVEKTSFTVDSTPVQIFGFNCYFLGFCSDQARASVLNGATSRGANVIRAWAFLDVESPQPDLRFFQSNQNGVPVYNDSALGLQSLDFLIRDAEQAGIRLILPLLNYWPDFGGIPMYCKWLNLANVPFAFYQSSAARDAYRAWVEYLLTRRNSITGRLYSDEPAIMAWELVNEPRGVSAADRELLLDWIGEMSRFVKTIDANHLLAVGDEGFFFRRGHGHLYEGAYGMDFEAILKLRSIDFGTFHFYPQIWGYEQHLEFGKRWIADHAAAGRRAGKPVLLEEFGLKIQPGPVASSKVRDLWYHRWIDDVRRHQAAGALLWMLGGSAPDVDCFCDEYTLLRADELPDFPVRS